jgi:hypothetical protein
MMGKQYSEMSSSMKVHRLPGLDLGDDFVYPDYEGRSLLNVPPSICGWLGAPPLGAQPLASPLSASLKSEYQNVIFILMDALSLRAFTRFLESGQNPQWTTLAQQGVLAPLTSITPSTTASALTSFWTGSSAAEHGIVGYEMWLKEYGMVVNSILHSPMSFQGAPGSLAKAGFDSESFIEQELLGAHLRQHGVQVYAYQRHDIVRSSLSRMLLRQVNLQSFRTQSDLWINARRVMEDNFDQRKYIWIYWGEVDYLSHHYGPDDERVASELSRFLAALEVLFLNQLSSSARKGTLLILSADHGQIKTQPDPHFDLNNHPGLIRRLHIMPTGENRLAALFLRPGQDAAVREYIERTWPGLFAFLDPAYAVEAGLFGPGKPHQHLHDRLGDLLVIARGEAYLWWSPKKNHLWGRHGGLSADEMLVPFLAIEL